MYVNLGECDDGNLASVGKRVRFVSSVGGGSHQKGGFVGYKSQTGRVGTVHSSGGGFNFNPSTGVSSRQLQIQQNLARNIARSRASWRPGSALFFASSDYDADARLTLAACCEEYDDTLGGFGKKFKKAFKKAVPKPLKKVAANIKSVHKIAASAALQTVGLKSLARKNIKLSQRQQNIAKSVRQGAQAVAVAAGAYVAAPYAFTAAKFVGAKALAGGKAVAGLVGKGAALAKTKVGGKLLGGLIQKIGGGGGGGGGGEEAADAGLPAGSYVPSYDAQGQEIGAPPAPYSYGGGDAPGQGGPADMPAQDAEVVPPEEAAGAEDAGKPPVDMGKILAIGLPIAGFLLSKK